MIESRSVAHFIIEIVGFIIMRADSSSVTRPITYNGALYALLCRYIEMIAVCVAL